MEQNDVRALDESIGMTNCLIGFNVDVHYLVLYYTAVDALNDEPSMGLMSMAFLLVRLTSSPRNPTRAAAYLVENS